MKSFTRIKQLAFAGMIFVASVFASATSMTDYLENKLADHIFRTTTYSQPAHLYLSLHPGACSDSRASTGKTGGS